MNNLLNIIVNTNIKFTNIPLVQNVLEDTEELNYNESIDSPQRIKQYISSNNLLDIKDKAFLLSLDELYNDNYKYMDNENLKNRLPNLAIIYNKISQNNDDSVSGEYYPKDNKIMLYKYDSFNEDNYDTELHEYMHALSNTGLTYDNPDGLALTEGITEFITSEYLDTFDKRKYIGSYRKQQVYAKMLCEILGKDSILEAYYKHDYNILIDELNKYSDKEEESIDLLRLINDEYKYEEELGSEAFKDEITSKNKVYKDIQNKIDLLYAKMFEKAKNYPMENDKIMCSYLDQIRKGNRANYELYQEGNTYYTEVKKNYINSNKDLTNTTIKYYYANKIAIKPDNTSFLLQGDGRYLYIDSNNERMYFDNIPEYILTDCINNEVTEENRKLNQKNR